MQGTPHRLLKLLPCCLERVHASILLHSVHGVRLTARGGAGYVYYTCTCVCVRMCFIGGSFRTPFRIISLLTESYFFRRYKRSELEARISYMYGNSTCACTTAGMCRARIPANRCREACNSTPSPSCGNSCCARHKALESPRCTCAREQRPCNLIHWKEEPNCGDGGCVERNEAENNYVMIIRSHGIPVFFPSTFPLPQYNWDCPI